MSARRVDELSPRRDRPALYALRVNRCRPRSLCSPQPMQAAVSNQQRDWVMQRNILRSALHGALLIGLTAAVSGCGGSGSTTATPTPMSGTMPLTISDASSDDWATIGVKLLSIALVPQGGGSAATVWSAPSPAPYVNLEQLDQLGEILGNVSVPVGTYTGALLTISANPGDLLLTVGANPESGFAVAAGTRIPSDQIQIQGRQGSSGNFTVPVNVTFDSPLTVTTSQNNALDLEFDLAHPAFIVGHAPPAASGAVLWAVNFKGPVRHHPVRDIARLALRHTYGAVKGVASDGKSLTITKDFPVLPVTNPETAITSALSLQIFADATNGTIVYDVDAKSRTVVKDFTGEAMSLPGKFVRIAARYQEDGTLVAVRVWASSEFGNVWLSPEGHVLHVDATTDVITVANESGAGVPVTVDASTEFFFRTPANASADATPIGTGMGFLANHDLVRGFKIHVAVVDPLATPLVAQTVDIENAGYSGLISSASTIGFTYTHGFPTVSDDYTVSLGYISNTSDNGKDSNGNAVMGYKWWNFTYPTLADTGANAVSDFVAATNGGVNCGGTVGSVKTYGVSAARWGDPANTTGWSVPWTVLLPAPIPLGTVSTGMANNAFTM